MIKNLVVVFIIQMGLMYQCLSLKVTTRAANTTQSTVENSARSLVKNNTDSDRIHFIVAKADYENKQDLDYKNIPILFPADAFLSPSSTEQKIKNNFSKIAKELIGDNKTENLAQSATSTTVFKLTTSLLDVNTFCILKTDGLYSDPSDCESFVICFANRTFKTKCAYGTMWNHIRNQCDFSEKVDCSRSTTIVPTTTELVPTTSTTSSKKTILVKKPKLFVVTSKPNLIKPVESMATTLTNNIILASIIIPALILLVVSIILTLWYWKKKFKLQAQKLHASKMLSSRNTSNNSSGMSGGEKKDDFLKKVSSLSLLKKFSKITSKNGQSSPIIQKEDKSSGKRNLIQTCGILETNALTTVPHENTGFIKEGPNTERLVLSENKPCDPINMTNLSSQFGENHLDYNIGSRALYLSQPWVKARYMHALGCESMETSGILTLDPTIDLGHEINKIIETGSESVTESEGYYA